MGGSISHFTQEEVTIYEACTCLDGAELANLYGKFVAMGGRRVPKGAEEAKYRHMIGQKTVRNMQAGADVALAQVSGDPLLPSAAAAALSQHISTPVSAGPPLTPNSPPGQIQATTEPESTRSSALPTKTQKVTKQQVCELPEFDNNPFAPRLCEVFSADGSGDLGFDELLDMFHALSPKAAKEVKILTAFRVYDFDGDGFLNAADISTLIRTTTLNNKKLR